MHEFSSEAVGKKERRIFVTAQTSCNMRMLCESQISTHKADWYQICWGRDNEPSQGNEPSEGKKIQR